MNEQALNALDRAIAALTCDEIEVFPAGNVPLLQASIGFELVQIEKSFSGRGKTLLSATAAAIDEALLAVAEARQLLAAEPSTEATQPAPRKRDGVNLRGAPLFLRPSVVRGLIDGVTVATKGTKAVPVAPIRLVNMPRRSEDPRLAKANDDFAMPSPPAPAGGTHEPGRVVPPVKPSAPAPEPATVNQAEPEGWPDAPLPEHADPDLDRAEPNPVPLEAGGLGVDTTSNHGVGSAYGDQSEKRGAGNQTGRSGPAGADACHRSGRTDREGVAAGRVLRPHGPSDGRRSDRAGRFDRPAAPSATTLTSEEPRRRDGIIRTNARRAERALEAPVDRVIEVAEAPRLNMIRAAAQRLADKRPQAAARPTIGTPRRAAPAPLPVLLPEVRRQRIAAATTFLAARGILVSVHDRLAQVRKYHVSGRRGVVLAEDVIALAVSLGLELPA